MRRPFRATLALAAVLCAPVAATAQQPLARTEPGHLPPVPQGGYELPLAPPLTHFPMRPRMTVLNTKLDWRKVGRIDKDLSLACADRDFIERDAMLYRAFFADTEVFGVAFGWGVNLVDRKKKSEKDKIYLFRHGDSTACVVIVLTREELAAIDSRATTPPPAKPGAGAKPGAAKPGAAKPATPKPGAAKP